jgi:hypothetical protein
MEHDNNDTGVELPEDLQPENFYSAIDQTFAQDWDDSRMADYDRYEELTDHDEAKSAN